MQHVMSIACFLSAIRPPGVQFDNALLQIAPVDKYKCPYINDKNDVNFQLYTKYNPTVYQTLLPDDDEKLFASNLDFHLPTVIFFHAFMERSDDGSGVAVREAYMQRGDTNVIMVDAQTLEAGPWYFTAAENTWFIGRFAAQFIDYLVSRGLDLSRTHLVGHSLGAQAAGVAGASLKSGRVARITGLDPALPLFSKLPLAQRLDPSDAEFVDVIHTDAGIFGYATPVGHADFYPNGGISPQPGCELEVVLHQQQFFNKCENETQPLGFYTFYLTANKRFKQFESEIEKFFTNLQKEKLKDIKEYKKSTTFKDVFRYEDSRYYFVDDDTNLHTQGDNKEMFERKESYEDQLKIDDLERKPVFPDSQIDKKDDMPNKTAPKNIKKDLNATDAKNEETTLKRKPDDVLINSQLHKKYDIPDKTKPTVVKEDLTKTGAKNEETTLERKADVQDSKLHKKDDIPHKTKPTVVKKDFTTTDAKNEETTTTHRITKRQKRFIPFFKQSEPDPDNFLFKMLEFLFKNRKSVVPVFSVMREINTLVKSANGELNHVSKERNNYIGAPPPTLIPVTYNLELANENKAVSFLKKLLGFPPKGDRLTISGK